MADNINYGKLVPTQSIGMEVDAMVNLATWRRKSFERKWYDNNFFDDGYHFRAVNRTTGKITDNVDGTQDSPIRAIPKASRQLRGIVNLLLGPDYVPVIYPEDVSQLNYRSPEEYQMALKMSKDIAKKEGHWIKEEWNKQELWDKMVLLMLLAAKNSVSYLQIWPDAVDEKIRTQVYDAFDIALLGDRTDIQDCPFIVKCTPKLIAEIKANENFDPEALAKMTPDNKYASSEIKDAYMRSKFGMGRESDSAATLIQKEAFMKVYLNKNNYAEVSQMAGKTGAMEGKKIGDVMIRHTFAAGGITLMDEYANLKKYPFVDFRYEPGPIYQKAIIENFIPANKTLDILATRVEKWANTMVTGTWMTRKGENFDITNIPGGQVLKYDSTPPVQGQMANVPSGIFDLMSFMEKVIEEQGASTSALGSIPSGVKSGIAIESVKNTEYANLKIASNQLKKCIKQITECMLDYASEYFIKPQTVSMMEKGEPTYFDIIGKKGYEAYRKVDKGFARQPIVISSEHIVNIEVQSGLGFTQEGRKETLKQIIAFFAPLIQQGLVSQDALKVIVKSLLDSYRFGSTQDVIDAMDTGTTTAPINEEQLKQIQIAVLQALKDSGMVGPEADQKLVDSTKLGTLETLKETGVLDKMNQPKEQVQAKGPSESISFKDLPPIGQVQMAQKAGIQLSPEDIQAEKDAETQLASDQAKEAVALKGANANQKG